MLIQCHGVVTLFPHTIFMAISKNQSDQFVDLSELILMELPTVKEEISAATTIKWGATCGVGNQLHTLLCTNFVQNFCFSTKAGI